MRELILGSVRFGKNRLAERCALVSGLAVAYVATATEIHAIREMWNQR